MSAIVDKSELCSKSSDDEVSYVVRLKKAADKLSAVTAQQAAELLSVNKRTVYRRLDDQVLELVPRDGKRWVSVRSIKKYMMDHYGRTPNFDLVQEVQKYHDKNDTSDSGCA